MKRFEILTVQLFQNGTKFPLLRTFLHVNLALDKLHLWPFPYVFVFVKASKIIATDAMITSPMVVSVQF